MPELDLSVILIHYNINTLLDDCLNSIYTHKSKINFEIIVVNKLGADGTPEFIKAKYPKVKLINTTKPFGIALIRNIGMIAARGKYILHLDVDTKVFKDTFEKMVSFMENHPDAGCAGGKLLSPDGSLQYSCRTFYDFPTILFRRTFLGKLFPNNKYVRNHLMMDWDHNTIREVDWVGGGFTIMRREAVQEVGLLDSKYFYAFEDTDWCKSAKKKGWKTYYVPDAKIIHIGTRPSTRFNRYMFEHLKSAMYYYWKHGFTK